MAWTVYATPPVKGGVKGWDFKGGYFPRTLAYKKDALVLAQEARDKGGSGVRIQKGK